MHTQTIISQLRGNPPADLLKKLAAIDEEDFGPIVKRVEKELAKQGKTVVLSREQAVVALKQYYGLMVATPNGAEYAVSSVLDPYWHAHILDTQGYARFCERTAGEFMHHVPLDETDEVEFSRVCGVYLQTGEALRQMFQDVSDVAFPLVACEDTVICIMYKGRITT